MILRFKRFLYNWLGLYDEACKYRLFALLAASMGDYEAIQVWETAYGEIWDVCGGKR